MRMGKKQEVVVVSLSRKSVCGCVRECDLLMRYYSVFQSVVTSKKVSGDWVLRRKRERERIRMSLECLVGVGVGGG